MIIIRLPLIIVMIVEVIMVMIIVVIVLPATGLPLRRFKLLIVLRWRMDQLDSIGVLIIAFLIFLLLLFLLPIGGIEQSTGHPIRSPQVVQVAIEGRIFFLLRFELLARFLRVVVRWRLALAIYRLIAIVLVLHHRFDISFAIIWLNAVPVTPNLGRNILPINTEICERIRIT